MKFFQTSTKSVGSSPQLDERAVHEVPLDQVPKSRWERSWPTIACGAGLFSDGYLNGYDLAQAWIITTNLLIVSFQCHWLRQYYSHNSLPDPIYAIFRAKKCHRHYLRGHHRWQPILRMDF